jgi:hypothetical protein
MLGKVVLTASVISPSAEIDISNLEAGIYFIEAASVSGTLRKKLVKE